MRPWLCFAISRNWSAIHALAANTPRLSPSFSENVLRVPKPTSFASVALSRSAETWFTTAAIAGSGAGSGAACAVGMPMQQARATTSPRIKSPFDVAVQDDYGTENRPKAASVPVLHAAAGSGMMRGPHGGDDRDEGASMATEKDYVLGTHDEEIERLGLQNRVWLSRAADAWHRAGFDHGQTLLDLGCGP